MDTIYKTKTKIIISATLVALLLFPPAGTYSHDGEIEQINSDIARLEQEIMIQKSNANSLEAQLALMDTQVKLLELQIELLQEKTARLQEDIENTEIEIERVKAEIEYKKKMAKEYIRTIAREDQKTMLEMIVSSNSFSDFIVRSTSLITVQNSVTRLLKELNELEYRLIKSLNKLKVDKDTLLKAQGEMLEKRLSLENEKVTKNKLLEESKGQEQQYQEELARKKEEHKAAFTKLSSDGGKNSGYVFAGKVPVFDFPLHRGYVTQGYGYTDYAKEGNYGGGIHNGVDFGIGAGEPIYAPAGGVVYAKGAEWCGGGCRSAYGNWLLLKHTYTGGDGSSTITYYTLFAHMQSPSSAGGSVAAGAIVGYVGSTGYSTGAHLHFSVFRVICPAADTSCNPSMPVNAAGPGWYATNSVDPFDFLKTPPAEIFCGGFTDWDAAYKHTDQCYNR